MDTKLILEEIQGLVEIEKYDEAKSLLKSYIMDLTKDQPSFVIYFLIFLNIKMDTEHLIAEEIKELKDAPYINMEVEELLKTADENLDKMISLVKEREVDEVADYKSRPDAFVANINTADDYQENLPKLYEIIYNNDLSPLVRIQAIELLVQNKEDTNITINIYNETRKFNPSKLTPIISPDDKVLVEISNLLNDYLMKEQTILSMSLAILGIYRFYKFDTIFTEDDVHSLFRAVVHCAKKSMGEPESFELDLCEEDLVSDINKALELHSSEN